MKRFKQSLLAVSILTASMSVAWADAGSMDRDREFDITRQPISTALKEFAQQANLQLLQLSGSSKNLTTKGLKGSYSPREALDILLAQSNLEYEFLDDDTVAIREISTKKEAEEIAERPAPEEMEEVVVTGTRLKLTPSQISAQTIIIDAEMLRLFGEPTLGRALRKLPMSSNDTTLTGGALGESQGDGSNFTGMSAVNLRGYGSDSTLVLVNGKRIGRQGNLGIATDISSIPVEVVERIEVLLDGASSVYGSDAMSGVVNIITKKDLDYSQVSINYGFPKEGGYDEFGVDVSTGFNWDSGNLSLFYSHFESNDLASGDREITALNTKYQGGQPWVYLGDKTYVVPEGFDPVDGTVGDLMPDPEGTSISGQSLLPEQSRDSLRAEIRQELGDIELQLGLSHSRSKTVTYADSKGWLVDFTRFPTSLYPSVSATSPYNPFGESFRIAGYEILGKGDYFESESESTNISFTLQSGFGDTSWDWEFSGGYTESTSDTDHKNQIDIWAYSSQYSNNFDLFGGTTNDLIIADLQETSITNEDQNVYFDGMIRGDLYKLPAGYVRSVLGFSYNKESKEFYTEMSIGSFSQLNSGFDRRAGVDQDTSLTTKAIFAEIFIPMIGQDDDLPLMKELNLTASSRYDRNDKTESSDTYSLGAVWQVNDVVSFSYRKSTAFKVPSLAQGYIDTKYTYSATSQRFYEDGTTNLISSHPVVVLRGGNDELKPEENKTDSLSLNLNPIDDLSLVVSYHKSEYINQIRRLSGVFSLRVGLPGWGKVPYPIQAVTVENATGPLSVGDTFEGHVVDQRWVNANKVLQQGLDVSLDYKLPTDSIGEFFIKGLYSRTDRFDVYNALGVPHTELDTAFAINYIKPRHKIFSTVGWADGAFSLSVNGSKISDVTRTHDGGYRKTKSPWIFDLQALYKFNDLNIDWLDNMSLNVIITNVTDKYSNHTFVHNDQDRLDVRVDKSTLNPRGRMIAAKIVKTF